MYIQWCRKYSPTRQMRVKILMDELKNAATSPTGDLYFLFFFKIIIIYIFFIESATPYNPCQKSSQAGFAPARRVIQHLSDVWMVK